MKRCIVIGKTNVGKTLFVLNFAAFLGLRHVTVTTKHPDSGVSSQTVDLDHAVREWVSDDPHHTRALYSLKLEVPVGKGVKHFEIVDTSGLIEGIPKEVAVRRAMAQTLAAVREADFVLHVVDAAQATTKGVVQAIGEVDYQVAQFAQMKGAYLILANKMDLPAARGGLERIRHEFAGHQVIPVSALTREGFREVKRFVWRWI